jgi:hypothetical protein
LRRLKIIFLQKLITQRTFYFEPEVTKWGLGVWYSLKFEKSFSTEIGSGTAPQFTLLDGHFRWCHFVTIPTELKNLFPVVCASD